MWVNTRSALGNSQKSGSASGPTCFRGWQLHSSEVRTRSGWVHQVRAHPEPGTGLSVRFSPSAESWTGPGSGSLKVWVRTKVRNRTATSLMVDVFTCFVHGPAKHVYHTDAIPRGGSTWYKPSDTTVDLSQRKEYHKMAFPQLTHLHTTCVLVSFLLLR